MRSALFALLATGALALGVLTSSPADAAGVGPATGEQLACFNAVTGDSVPASNPPAPYVCFDLAYNYPGSGGVTITGFSITTKTASGTSLVNNHAALASGLEFDNAQGAALWQRSSFDTTYDLGSNPCPTTACATGQRGDLTPSGAHNSGTKGTFLLSGWSWSNSKATYRHGGFSFSLN